MKKKLLLLISMLVIASMVLVACGGQETPTEAPVEPTEAPPSPCQKNRQKNRWKNPPKNRWKNPPKSRWKSRLPPSAFGQMILAPQFLSELADDFLEAYNVEVIVEEVSGINEQFPIAAPAGEGPDITIVPHDQAGAMVASGLLAPLDLGAKADNFVAGTLAAATYDGVLYGMPYATENMGFFYNTDLVPEPPTTWDEVLEMGKASAERW